MRVSLGLLCLLSIACTPTSTESQVHTEARAAVVEEAVAAGDDVGCEGVECDEATGAFDRIMQWHDEQKAKPSGS